MILQNYFCFYQTHLSSLPFFEMFMYFRTQRSSFAQENILKCSKTFSALHANNPITCLINISIDLIIYFTVT